MNSEQILFQPLIATCNALVEPLAVDSAIDNKHHQHDKMLKDFQVICTVF